MSPRDERARGNACRSLPPASTTARACRRRRHRVQRIQGRWRSLASRASGRNSSRREVISARIASTRSGIRPKLLPCRSERSCSPRTYSARAPRSSPHNKRPLRLFRLERLSPSAGLKVGTPPTSARRPDRLAVAFHWDPSRWSCRSDGLRHRGRAREWARGPSTATRGRSSPSGGAPCDELSGVPPSHGT
jgi:hypothetical protein